VVGQRHDPHGERGERAHPLPRPIRGAGRRQQHAAGSALRERQLPLRPQERHHEPGRAISGRFLETSRNVGGNISGRASPGTIQARAEGAGFSASLAVSTKGNQQSVTIQAPAAEVQEVSITMRKG
jgi:hypothetical protein